MEKIVPISESPLDGFRGRRPMARIIDITQGKQCIRLRVICPFCRAIHKHGGGETDSPTFGMRRAHCSKGSYFIPKPQESVVVPRIPSVASEDPDVVVLPIH